MSRLGWKCERCGVRSTLLPDQHRCMTVDLLRYRALKKQRREEKRLQWTPEMEELADYAKKSAVRQVRNFIDGVLSLVQSSNEPE